MPPHQAVVDVDCLDDMFDNHQPISSLFRDDNDNSGHSRGISGPVVVPPVTPSTPCRLLRRQANPEFAAVIAVCPSRERTISTEDYLSSSPAPPPTQRKQPVSRQSRITEIIGPESAYVKSSLTHSSVVPPALNSGRVTTTTTTDETKTIVVLPHNKPDTPSSSIMVSPSNEVGNLTSVEQKQPSSSLFRRYMPKLKRIKGVSLRSSLVK